MAKAKKRAKKPAAKQRVAGMGELLDLLKTRPHLVRTLLVDHAKVRRLLKTRAARQLLPTGKTLYVEGEGYDTPQPPLPHYVILRCLKRSA